jgi:hypothetical protein
MEQQSLTTFVYNTLTLEDSFSIRLINLHSATEVTSDLRCDITHIDLLDDVTHHPPYTALSYAWGSDEKPCALWCGMTRIPITASLDTALRAIRKPTWPFLIWVDAVCINQENLQERNTQVANMIHVYSRASSVLVWLGEDDTKLNGAKCLEWLQFAGRRHFGALQSEITPIDMTLLEVFFSKDWFKRRWVIQEVAVAVHAFVICGTKRISWYDFIEGVAVLRVRHDTIATDGYHEALGKLCTIEVLKKTFRGCTATTNDGPSFLQIMLHFEASLCRNDKDKVFSLIHVAALEHAALMALSSGLDYSLSTETVYQRVAEVFLKSSDHFSLLHYAAAFRPEANERCTLPSWVPDWRFRCRFRPMLHPSFKCGLNRPGGFTICHDGALRIRGFIYQYVGADSHLVSSSRKQFTDITKASEAILDKEYSEDMSLLRTPADPRLILSKYERKAGLDWFSEITRSRQLLSTTEQTYKSSPEDHERITFVNASSAFTEDHLHALTNSRESRTLRGRKLFATKRGLLGLGPDDVKEGDAVVVLYGACTPFILRSNATGTKWRIVGDAYVSHITTKAVENTHQEDRDFHVV